VEVDAKMNWNCDLDLPRLAAEVCRREAELLVDVEAPGRLWWLEGNLQKRIEHTMQAFPIHGPSSALGRIGRGR
jgi:hypothetical protein